MIKVGLLYDSVSKNTGDVAIGLALQDFCDENNFPYEVINPFDFNPGDYSTIIIGGGFLIREPGDRFYDIFRLEGNNCVLNGVGIAAATKFDYLGDYKRVSVRSSVDYEILSQHVKNVAVVPCITTRMRGERSPSIPKFTDRTIGIHLVSDTMIHMPDALDVINRLPHDKVFFPFTHYNMDMNLMRSLPGTSNHLVLDELNPRELYSVIGEMEFVITSSLHASIFAYIQNVPFLTFYQQKTYDYFKDRGLEKYICKPGDDFRQKLQTLIANDYPSFEAPIKQDKELNKANEKVIIKIIKEDGKVFKQSTSRKKSRKQTNLSVEELQVEQLRSAIVSRDILINKLYGGHKD